MPELPTMSELRNQADLDAVSAVWANKVARTIVNRIYSLVPSYMNSDERAQWMRDYLSYVVLDQIRCARVRPDLWDSTFILVASQFADALKKGVN